MTLIDFVGGSQIFAQSEGLVKADGKDLLDTGKAFSVILVGMPGIVISSLMVGIGFIQDLTTVFSLKDVEMRSKLDHETPEVGAKNGSQYKKGVTHESMKPGDAEKGKRPKEESNTGGERD